MPTNRPNPPPGSTLPPAVCSDCLGALFEAIPTGDTAVRHVFCGHRGAGTLLRVNTVDGSIGAWTLRSPVTRSEAAEEVAQVHRLLEQSGLSKPDGPTH